MTPLHHRLLDILARQPLIARLLDAAEAAALPDHALGAGLLTQTTWNHLTGQPLDAHLKDVDLIYFDDTDLSEEAEAERTRRVAAAAGPLPLPLDVTNQARVHLWYPQAFGRESPPYTSTAQAIATWPTTASSLGLTRRAGALHVIAPFGLEDLFGLVVRPNRALVPQAVYEAKAARWKRCWPALTVVPW